MSNTTTNSWDEYVSFAAPRTVPVRGRKSTNAFLLCSLQCRPYNRFTVYSTQTEAAMEDDFKRLLMHGFVRLFACGCNSNGASGWSSWSAVKGSFTVRPLAILILSHLCFDRDEPYQISAVLRWADWVRKLFNINWIDENIWWKLALDPVLAWPRNQTAMA